MRTRVTYAAWSLLLMGSAPVIARLTSAPLAALVKADPLEMTGLEYVQLSPREQEAYVAGFVTGAATAQALQGTGALEERLDALRGARELRFYLGVVVYATALREYYTSPETVQQRISQAMVAVHDHLISHAREM